MDDGAPGATTPPIGPTLAFLLNSSTPATRRSPFAEFKASPARDGRALEPPLALPRVNARAASAEGRRPHSRSPQTASSAVHDRGGGSERVSEGTAAEVVRRLQAAIDAMDKQRADRKWFADNAKRIDKLEAQVREQTKEAMECARAKCVDIDGRIRDVDVRLRAELDDNIIKLLSGLETKVSGSVPGIVDTRVKALEKSIEDKIKECIDGLDQTIEGLDQTVRAQQRLSEQHPAYLKARVDAKPGEEQTLVSYFKHLEEDVSKVTSMQAASPDPAHAQKILNETKSMV